MAILQAYAAAETIDVLARSLERSATPSSRILFTCLIHSGYKRAYQTGAITGRRLEEMHRLERSFDGIFKRYKCWGEIHSLERFRARWHRIQRLFFTQSPSANLAPKYYVVFSHGNLLSGIMSFLTSDASWDRWYEGNIAPHCSVSVLSYKPGNALPEVILTPFQISSRVLPITINNINPRKMRLHEVIPTGAINEQSWKMIVNSVIPERVVGSYTDQLSRISEFIPGNDEEARHMLLVFQQYCAQTTTTANRDQIDGGSDSDDEEDDDGKEINDGETNEARR